jgi:hypothetical protein
MSLTVRNTQEQCKQIALTLVAALTIAGHAPMDAHRLRTGRFVMVTRDQGREVGRGRLTIRRLAGVRTAVGDHHVRSGHRG